MKNLGDAGPFEQSFFDPYSIDACSSFFDLVLLSPHTVQYSLIPESWNVSLQSGLVYLEVVEAQDLVEIYKGSCTKPFY